MAAELIDGKKLAAETRAQIAAGVAALKSKKGASFWTVRMTARIREFVSTPGRLATRILPAG